MFLDGVAPYALEPAAKATFLLQQLHALLEHHRTQCPPYANVVDDWQQHGVGGQGTLEAYPFLPVTVFKVVSSASRLQTCDRSTSKRHVYDS